MRWEFTHKGGKLFRRTKGVKATARFALCFVHVKPHRLRRPRSPAASDVLFNVSWAGQGASTSRKFYVNGAARTIPLQVRQLTGLTSICLQSGQSSGVSGSSYRIGTAGPY